MDLPAILRDKKKSGWRLRTSPTALLSLQRAGF